jgi:CoA:oxalate CoA-transferase
MIKRVTYDDHTFDHKAMQPLQDITIIEFGNFIAAPFATMLLADMGANVIKVEPAGLGDMARATPPFVDGHSASFMALNRNKRSVVLDLKSEAGRQAALDLVRSADAVVENFRPGVMDSLGLGADTLRALKPELVCVSVSGFGQTGSARRRAAVNLIIEAAAGTLSVTGEPGQMPVRPGIQTGDMFGAMFACYAVLCGLLGAARHGQGRTVDVSLVEASLAVAAFETADLFATGVAPQPLGNRHRLTAPYQLFECQSGRHVAIGCPNDGVFKKLCEVLGLTDLPADPRFSSYAQRKLSEEALLPLVQDKVAQWEAQALCARLELSGIPCSPVCNYEESLYGAEGQERARVDHAPHSALGQFPTVRNPVLFDQGSPRIARGAPLLGEHTQEVLAALAARPDDEARSAVRHA